MPGDSEELTGTTSRLREATSFGRGVSPGSSAVESPIGDAARLAGGKVVVTGGSGFIGGHVIAALCRLGADVTSVDRRPAPGNWRCHPAQGEAAGGGQAHRVRALQGDLREAGVVEAAISPGTRAIVHLAAQTQVLRSLEDPQGSFDNNVAVTQALLERARQLQVGCFVFASTNAVVGAGASGTIREAAPLVPLSPYGATKAAGEMLLSCYNAAYGLRAVALRFTNVYGPGMSEKDSIVPRLMRVALSGGTFDIYGDGKQVRDYVNVADVTRAVLVALEEPEMAGPVIIGSGASVSVLDLVEVVEGALGKRVNLRHVAAKAGEMPAVVVDISRARSFGWEPEVSLEQGIAEVVAEWGAASA
jgi:UDP-glucose 4-epimerase